MRLVFVGGTPDNYWPVVRLGCDFATRQLNDVDRDFRFLENGTPAAQQELLSTLVTNGTDGVVISRSDPETQTDFLNALATNTLLLCADSDAEKTVPVETAPWLIKILDIYSNCLIGTCIWF